MSNTNIGIVGAGIFLGAGLLTLASETGPTVPAHNSAVIMSLAATTAVADTVEFVSSNKCKMCHNKQYKSWKKTKMAQTFNVLKPGQAGDAKAKLKLDPGKDYTADASCLPCHTTGHGKPGGYAVPDASDKKAVKAAKRRRGVGCEACHGAGSPYVDLHKEILMSKRKYTVEEMVAAGTQAASEAGCVTCHNDKAPHAVESFDFAKRKQEGTHEHFPLKQRK